MVGRRAYPCRGVRMNSSNTPCLSENQRLPIEQECDFSEELPRGFSTAHGIPKCRMRAPNFRDSLRRPCGDAAVEFHAMDHFLKLSQWIGTSDRYRHRPFYTLFLKKREGDR